MDYPDYSRRAKKHGVISLDREPCSESTFVAPHSRLEHAESSAVAAPLDNSRIEDLSAQTSVDSAFNKLLKQLAQEHTRRLQSVHTGYEKLIKAASSNLSSRDIRINSVPAPRCFVHGVAGLCDCGPDHMPELKHGPQSVDATQDTLTMEGARSKVQQSSDPNPAILSHTLLEGFGDAVVNAVCHDYMEKILEPVSTRVSKISTLALPKWWRLPSEELETGLCSKIVNSTSFDSLCACAIVMNSFLLGFSTDQAAKIPSPDDLPQIFEILDLIFLAWFVLELLLRLVALGFCSFLLGSHCRWNVFDSVVVSFDLFYSVSKIISPSESNGGLMNVTAIRILRVLRIARALRVIRLMRFCKDLRLMVMSILESGASLLWCVVLLSIVIYVFSIFLMQNVTYYLYEHRDDPRTEDTDFLKNKFGSLVTSSYTLFQAVSGGISWYEIADPLITIHWTNGLLFCFYIFFTSFALLNIITGVFVSTAMSSAQNDDEEFLQEQMNCETSILARLKNLFKDLNEDKSPNISWPSFCKSLQDSRVRAHMSFLGMDVHEARGLFKLLDLDESGEISIEEFVYGCMRLRGNAKSVDLTTLLYEHKRMVDKFNSFYVYVKREFARQRELE